MKYVERLTTPEKGNKYYIHHSKGGYNTCMKINEQNGSVIPNCVGYAQGRLLEIMGAKGCNWKLPAGYAEDWYDTAIKNGMTVTDKPELGSVACWKQGKTNNPNDGAGHVAVVELINNNGEIMCSQSHAKGIEFDLVTLSPSNGYKYKDGFVLQGFISCGIDFLAEEKEIVMRNYIDILCREADDSGLRSWSIALHNGMTEDDLRTSLLNSKEYIEDTTRLQREDYVIKCYRNILGRFPESEAVINHWKKYSKEEIFYGIWNSEEAINRRK